MPKIVREMSTWKTVYRQNPDFKKGLGIKNACLSEGYRENDLVEIELTQEEYDADLQTEMAEIQTGQMIRDEMNSILREQAIQNLKDSGQLPLDYQEKI